MKALNELQVSGYDSNSRFVLIWCNSGSGKRILKALEKKSHLRFGISLSHLNSSGSSLFPVEIGMVNVRGSSVYLAGV